MVFLSGLVLVFKIKVIISVHISSKILDFCRLKGLVTNRSVLFVRVTRGPWGQVSPLGGLRGLIWRPTGETVRTKGHFKASESPGAGD